MSMWTEPRLWQPHTIREHKKQYKNYKILMVKSNVCERTLMRGQLYLTLFVVEKGRSLEGLYSNNGQRQTDPF